MSAQNVCKFLRAIKKKTTCLRFLLSPLTHPPTCNRCTAPVWSSHSDVTLPNRVQSPLPQMPDTVSLSGCSHMLSCSSPLTNAKRLLHQRQKPELTRTTTAPLPSIHKVERERFSPQFALERVDSPARVRTPLKGCNCACHCVC